MSKTGIAMIGLGLAVEPHARSLADLADRAEVRWAASRSPERTGAFAKRHPFPVTTDVAAAIADPAVDAVMILTPPNTHLELCEAAFAQGKHVLLEKPLEVTRDRAERLVAAADDAGVTLGVVLQHRFRDSALRLADLVAEGALGRIEAASVTVPWWRPQSYYEEPGRGTLARDGGGVLMTQAIHPLDLFRSLVEPVEVTAAHAATTGHHEMETEDYASALLRVSGGAPGTLMATTALYPGHPERIEIVGSLGTARILGSDLHVDYLSGAREEIVSGAGTGGGADPMDFPHDAHCRLIEDFLDAVRDGRAPRVSGMEALRTQALIDDILNRAGRG